MAPEHPRMRTAVRDFAGAFGDLGTFLPLVVGGLTVGALGAPGVLAAFGIGYLLTAWVYRAPVPVQPMKVAAAVLITAGATPGTVAGAGFVLAAFFLVAGATGLVARIARWVPDVVTAALQTGLGISLAWLACTQIVVTPGLGAALVALAALLLALRPGWPVAIIVLAAGIGAGHLLGLGPRDPVPAPAPDWPALYWPGGADLLRGTLAIALPQIPLTLTNAVLVTAAVGRAHFPRARRLDATPLALTTGAMNLVAAPLAGMPICHGAGGVTAHHRFGARTALAPVIIGVILLGLGLGWGDGAPALLAHVPDATLGALLLVPALDLVRTANPLGFAGRDRILLAAGAAVAVWSPGVAFLVAITAVLLLRRRAADSA